MNGSNTVVFFFRRLLAAASSGMEDLGGGGGGGRRRIDDLGLGLLPSAGFFFGTPGFDSHEKGTEEERVEGLTGEGSVKGELRRVDDDEDEDGDCVGDVNIGEKLRVLIESSLFTASVLHLSDGGGGGFVLFIVGVASDKDDNEEESMVELPEEERRVVLVGQIRQVRSVLVCYYVLY